MNSEILRQGLHVAAGLICALVAYYTTSEISILVFAGLFTLGLLVSLLHKHMKLLDELRAILSNVERSGEQNIPGQGAITFALGIFIASVILYPFGKQVIMGAILALTFGDAFSTLIGKSFGRTKIIGERTLEGSVGGIAAATIALAALFPLHIALAASIAGMAAEYLPINDNYTTPIAAGLAIAILL